MLPPALTDPLTRFLDEDEDRSALDAACHAARELPLDTAALFHWLAQQPADDKRRRRAAAGLRAALGLPLIPGPPCKIAP